MFSLFFLADKRMENSDKRISSPDSSYQVDRWEIYCYNRNYWRAEGYFINGKSVTYYSSEKDKVFEQVMKYKDAYFTELTHHFTSENGLVTVFVEMIPKE